MPIRIRCPNRDCRRVIECQDEQAGSVLDCPDCKTRMKAPAVSKAKELMLGDYRLVKKIGQGGMGAVYEAIQLKLERRVALKVLPSQFTNDPDYLSRFQREAKAAASLNHSGIIQVYDIGEDDGTHFFAMEYVDGKSVQDVLDDEVKLSVERALEIIEGVAKALKYAHGESIIHRDIKPDNVMLTRTEK